MFSTTIETKSSFPFQNSAKIYDNGCSSPRTGRFGSSMHQYVIYNDAPIAGSNIASHLPEDDPINSVPAIPIFKSTHLEDICSES